MKKILDLLSEEMGKAFEEAGYEASLGRVTLSNRPDLCEYQCNGAMAGAKKYRKAPIMIANEVALQLGDSPVFQEAAAVAPGFLNLRVSEEFLLDMVRTMAEEEKFGLEMPGKSKKIMIDYGGANVAKPLHVGHLRPAIIGESIKRICRYAGHEVIGDVHLGDWGTPIGMVITELQERKPDLLYFDESYDGAYPEEPPVTEAEFAEIYPLASTKAKADPEYRARALEATRKFQTGVRGYRALWKVIVDISKVDLKRNYDSLNVEFDLWKGESDVNDLIPEMVTYMKENGYAHISEGALVVDVKEETDTREIPPCMILKSDGASLYNTTDLATIMERMRLYAPDEIIYITDKRQELYFEQVFRCARKTKLVKPETVLKFLGHGTMNGSDGKPFKTRDGGVMRLENLIGETRDEMYRKIREGREMPEEEAKETAETVAISALKYGDLSNQAAKDYIFDIDRFTSFEGDTGPYILYTVVRIKSILNKYQEQGGEMKGLMFLKAGSESEKALEMALVQFNTMMMNAAEEKAPHRVCAYIYDLANAFNHFYHETKILAEADEDRRRSLIALLMLTRDVLETCIDLLGFSAPEKM
ncbi:arginine--tRNA ligase [Acetatifactor muris]|jgi:arginyl-tRNA synthetase|uniref:Arginine--tRNA ligase n=1 Tax=Acetatifactor muris TaxID=879566 RepID=A0A2K4ZDD8_9FIRM|nr:arginine--tRNA ligase [Acetatifactor muris]MCI8799380.1 arginine--tRNA ligase [Lachnospiraceae bacterium]MCR2046939.1 arginine--tRNA ligase [Acetatifactor muris]SOY28472.1 Arginine--tRNA ligase [Acetatifactor muris]